MDNALSTIETNQLEQVTGGNGMPDIGGMIGQFGGLLEQFGVKGAGQGAQMAQGLLGQILPLIQGAGGSQTA